MARPDGKSVYVTLPAERKTPFSAFAEGGVFLVLSDRKTDFGFTIFRFYSLFKETNIGFYSFYIRRGTLF